MWWIKYAPNVLLGLYHHLRPCWKYPGRACGHKQREKVTLSPASRLKVPAPHEITWNNSNWQGRDIVLVCMSVWICLSVCISVRACTFMPLLCNRVYASVCARRLQLCIDCGLFLRPQGLNLSLRGSTAVVRTTVKPSAVRTEMYCPQHWHHTILFYYHSLLFSFLAIHLSSKTSYCAPDFLSLPLSKMTQNISNYSPG